MTTKQFHKILEAHELQFIKQRGINEAVVLGLKDQIRIAREDFPLGNSDNILLYHVEIHNNKYFPIGKPIETLSL